MDDDEIEGLRQLEDESFQRCQATEGTKQEKVDPTPARDDQR